MVYNFVLFYNLFSCPLSLSSSFHSLYKVFHYLELSLLNIWVDNFSQKYGCRPNRTTKNDLITATCVVLQSVTLHEPHESDSVAVSSIKLPDLNQTAEKLISNAIFFISLSIKLSVHVSKYTLVVYRERES